MLGKIAIGLVLALVLAIPAAAQDFYKGMFAARHGKYAAALKEWQPLAAKGHARAQYNIGFMYEQNPTDPRFEVRVWSRCSTEQHSRSYVVQPFGSKR